MTDIIDPVNADLAKAVEQTVTDSSGSLREQCSAGQILQAHCLSVERQPLVDFGSECAKDEKLKSVQEDSNKLLAHSKDDSARYLDVLMPRIIGTAASVQDYYSLHAAIARELAATTSKEDAKSLLLAMQEQSQTYGTAAAGIRTDLQGLRGRLASQSEGFDSLAGRLNVIFEGNSGTLATIRGELEGIDGKIAGAATGVALGGRAAIAGAIMIAIGAFGSVFTGGTSTTLCVAGGAVLLAGAGAATGASIALGGLLNLKSDLLMRQASISAQMTMVDSLRGGLGNLARSAEGAQQGAQAMALSWDYLDKHLGMLVGNLDKGKTDIAALRRVFVQTAESSVQAVLRDVEKIQDQMTGVHIVRDDKRRVGDVLITAANDPEAIARATRAVRRAA